MLNQDIPLSKRFPKRTVSIEMFRGGNQTDSEGDSAFFTNQDLEDVVKTYNPSYHEAPLLLGHHQDDDTPALGWVQRVWRKGSSIWGEVELTPRAEKLVSEGTFKKVSSSFYAPEAESNPYPGKLSLRHLALVTIPAIKGLKSFSEKPDEIIVDSPAEIDPVLFKELLDHKKTMPQPRKKQISDHGEGMSVVIKIDSKDSNVPVYTDEGNQLSDSGLPADYEDMDYAKDESSEEFLDDVESTDDPEMPPPEGELEGELEGEPGGEPEGMPGGEPEGEPESMPEEAPTPEVEESQDVPEVKDISSDVNADEETVADLASKFSVKELLQAVELKKQSNTESADFSESMPEEVPTNDFADCGDDDKDTDKKEYSEDEDEEPSDAEKEETDDYSEEESSEDSAEDLKRRIAKLEEELHRQKKAAREKEISDFCEKVYSEGKLTPSMVDKDDLVRFMATLNSKNSINFSESNKKSQYDFFAEVVSNLPQVVSFSEVAPPDPEPTKTKPVPPAKDFVYPDSESVDIHAKALEFAEAKNVDYITALKAVYR